MVLPGTLSRIPRRARRDLVRGRDAGRRGPAGQPRVLEPRRGTRGGPLGRRSFQANGPAGRHGRDGGRAGEPRLESLVPEGQGAVRRPAGGSLPVHLRRRAGQLAVGDGPLDWGFRWAEDRVDFLQLAGKTILVMGVANRKSVAFHVACLLEEAGAKVVYAVRTEERRRSVARLLGADASIHVCDVEHDDQIARLAEEVGRRHTPLAGLVHSIAFADYAGRSAPFHATPRAAFLRSVDISCYSLMALSNALRETLDADASVVTISISTTRMASENYAYMAPVKAALDSSLAF